MLKLGCIGAMLSAAVLAGCGTGGSALAPVPASALSSHAQALCVPASLTWCSQLHVKGSLTVTDPPYNWDSCADPAAPGCPANWQSLVVQSQHNHSFRYKDRSASFDEDFTGGLGGLFRYSVGTTATVKSVSTASANVDGAFGSFDTLKITSKNHSANYPVKLLVTLTVTPGAAEVGCDQLGSSDANLDVSFYWPEDGDEQPLHISGSCDGGSFIYRIADGLTGTSSSVVFKAAVGKEYRFGFAGVAASNSTATTNNSTPNTVNTVLSGKAILDIIALTPGTAFKTASGFEYNIGNGQR